MSTVRPNLFLVGVQRSATTAMWTYLREHPDVFMAPKEAHYFGRDLGVFDGVSDPGRRPTLDEYLALFAPSVGEHCLGDASVGYIYSTTAAEEIHAFNPDARIVASFRNPVDMAYSLYSLMRFQGAEDAPDFVGALVDGANPRWAFTAYPFRWAFTYPRLLRFSEQLERFLDVFGRRCVHVIVYEDVASDVAGEYRKLLEFLEVDPEFQPEFPVVGSNRESRSRVLRRWLEHTPPVVRAAGRVVVPTRSARRALGATLTAHNQRPTDRPSLDPGLRARLEEGFADEVGRFGALIGRDLSDLWLPAGSGA